MITFTSTNKVAYKVVCENVVKGHTFTNTFIFTFNDIKNVQEYIDDLNAQVEDPNEALVNFIMTRVEVK